MMSRLTLFITTFCLLGALCVPSTTRAQSNTLHQELAKGLTLREIGPAMMGGRIADIAINPADPSNWYIAVGSGGLWKTKNRGITWTPVFDGQKSYSIGTVELDPNNPNVIWVGTGENVSGRHVGWGDGLYRSRDAGKTWEQVGLAKSEHIGRILIDPRNSNIIMVAAEGPLWSGGGERGLYRSADGGKTWTASLQIDENTGVTDIEFDPANPDIVYAAAYQRRRHTWSLLAGGPKSGIYKSTDNGQTWRQVKTGLPGSDMGKIGLTVTAADPNRVYATIEASDKEKGFYRSNDKGESWTKMNGYISGGTGPHYYQEIEASQTNPDLIYQMDVFLHVTRDGGKTFDYLGTGREKHSDNHALWIDPDNGNHLIAGSDGGLYETFDEGTTWRAFANLPISQFYKAALDNAEPYYNVVVGAQDLGTLIGPSRTLHTEGVRNQDWYVPLGADGYDCAFDPKDPNIVYMEIQGGELYRLDRRTEEVVYIKPVAAAGDAPERWNWDSPVLVSPHDNKTLYFGSQRVWKTADQGNSWTPISGDLTTNRNRYELKMIDNVPSIDALYDNGAMSLYATLTSIDESRLSKGLIYTGSDDGLIQVSEDGGQQWRKAKSLPEVPALSFINDIEASKHDANVVFAAADAHKLGDYTTYLFMSTNKGKSWQSIKGDLPAKTIVWSIKQDHIDANLLFAGTEYGLYFTTNKGKNWHKLQTGVPTISFRDVELHERENDLVGASFGRGVFVLDDYAALREAGNVAGNSLFPVRDAWWYVPSEPYQAKGMPSQGSASYRTPNPPDGALLTYYLRDMPKTAKEQRQTQEKKLNDQSADIPFPGWDELKAESLEGKAMTMILIRDSSGKAIRWLKGASGTGVHRVNWDLRMPAPNPISLRRPSFVPPWAGTPQGPLVVPGEYSAELYLVDNGALSIQGQAQKFMVKAVHPQADEDNAAYQAFTLQTMELMRQLGALNNQLGEAGNKLRHMAEAIAQSPALEPGLFKTHKELQDELAGLREALYGHPIRSANDEANVPSISSKVWGVSYGHWGTTQLPTATQRQAISQAAEELTSFATRTKAYAAQMAAFEKALEAAGAPYTPGRKLN